MKENVKVIEAFGWVRVKRVVPGQVAGLVLPEGASREGRSQWYMEQDLPELNLVAGDQIIPTPDVWYYKVNPDDKDCQQFLFRCDHILAKVENV